MKTALLSVMGLATLVLLFQSGCESTGSSSTVEATSLLGAPLRRPQLSETARHEREQQLRDARARYTAKPRDETAAIWYGRRLAYLGRYRDAIDIFTDGLRANPRSFRLLRHRGHRYITLRQFDRAIDDLSRAAELMRAVPDEAEPDGMPNAAGIPTSTTKTNIWYHLGLAQYLNGNFDASRAAYARCLALATNDDTRCAASYWLVLNQRRAGMTHQAQDTLAAITADMNVIENTSYRDLLLMFKGELSPADLVPDDAGDGVQDATVAYGMAMWELLNGDRAEAQHLLQSIVDAGSWAAFGSIAAEAELARGF